MTYQPDEQDEPIGDAMAVGGPAFVEELHWAAMSATEVVCPWDSNGSEPPAYRRAWLEEVRRLISQRRTKLGAGLDDAAVDDRSAQPESTATEWPAGHPVSYPAFDVHDPDGA